LTVVDGSGSIFKGKLSIAENFPRPAIEEWQEAAVRSLRGQSLDALSVVTDDGLELKPLYTAEDIPAKNFDVPPPRSGQWETCALIDDPEPRRAAAQITEDRERGAHSILVVGSGTHNSVQLSAVQDLEPILASAGEAPVYFDGGGSIPALAALVVAANGSYRPADGFLRGGFDYDPLGSLAAACSLPWSLQRSFQLMTEIVRWARDESPEMRVLAASALPYSAAKPTAVQDLAIVLATGVEYLRALDAHGLPPEVGLNHLRVMLPVRQEFFLEIAKLRAARWTWERLSEACGLRRSQPTVPIHAITAPHGSNGGDSWTDLIRKTVEAFATVAAGADVLTVLPINHGIDPTDDLARRLALNTSNILREESHLGQVADPAAGSYFLERLTEDLATAAWAEFQRIERFGGMAAAMRSGYPHRRLGEETAIIDAMTFEQAVEAASAGATLAEIVTGLAGDSEPEQNQGQPGVGND
jgi:methylmalonyl-CoA mutase